MTIYPCISLQTETENPRFYVGQVKREAEYQRASFAGSDVFDTCWTCTTGELEVTNINAWKIIMAEGKQFQESKRRRQALHLT